MKWSYTFNENLITPRMHKRLMNDLLWAVGNIHKDVTLPGHFRQGAARKYHYKRRTVKYLKWKEKKAPGKPDLVLTGLLSNWVVAKSKVTATANKWRIYCKAPFPLPDWMRDEIERVLKGERSDYIRMLKRHYTRKVKLSPYARRRAVKITP